MTLQWTAVAGFLYVESAVLFLLCLPFISPRRWQRVFQLGVWKRVNDRFRNGTFLAAIAVLTLLFLDAAREVRKYSPGGGFGGGGAAEPAAIGMIPTMLDHVHMRLFRAQRNMHISGFALFLWLVVRRVVTLINQVVRKTAEHDALLKAQQQRLQNLQHNNVKKE